MKPNKVWYSIRVPKIEGYKIMYPSIYISEIEYFEGLLSKGPKGLKINVTKQYTLDFKDLGIFENNNLISPEFRDKLLREDELIPYLYTKHDLAFENKSEAFIQKILFLERARDIIQGNIAKLQKDLDRVVPKRIEDIIDQIPEKFPEVYL